MTYPLLIVQYSQAHLQVCITLSQLCDNVMTNLVDVIIGDIISELDCTCAYTIMCECALL